MGNQSSDDAAVYGLTDDIGIISTTDFFMPIVDDPFDFGRIAATNSISDIYAMGGTPIMAIAILGWPVDKLGPEIARKVIEGGRSICDEAGITLAGGHSIDAPEPMFGLAVTGKVEKKNLKQNNQAKEGDLLFVTKPLGIGILTTAEKKGILKPEDIHLARDEMVKLNKIGADIAKLHYAHALTDITGFGLLGHLAEIADGSNLSAVVTPESVPLIKHTDFYIKQGAVPGGCQRNFGSYGHKIEPSPLLDEYKTILCDPQTSGGLLITVDPSYKDEFIAFLENHEYRNTAPIGYLECKGSYTIRLNKK